MAFHCVYVPHLHFPFIHWRTFRLVPLPGCCDWNSSTSSSGMLWPFSVWQGIVEQDTCTFRFLQTFHTDLRSGCTRLHPHHHFLSFVFLVLAILRPRWNDISDWFLKAESERGVQLRSTAQCNMKVRGFDCWVTHNFLKCILTFIKLSQNDVL